MSIEMKEKRSALHSEYIIDGVQQELTPAEILNGRSLEKNLPREEYVPIADERLDPDLKPSALDAEQMHYYLAKALSATRGSLPRVFAASLAKGFEARALADTLWRRGHFRLGDIGLRAHWHWDASRLGSSASFYASCEAVGDFTDALGLSLLSYSYEESETCRLSFETALLPTGSSDDILDELPFHANDPHIEADRAVPAQIFPDESSWIIFIPFDSCDFRLGGSLLADALHFASDVAPETGDADYFMDCYEIVRELVEDGILLAGCTVGDGGLLTTLKRMTVRAGAVINISDLKQTYHEQNVTRILLSEIPGVIIQIRDQDFDYLDAEMLLQDVVFFPLGHPKKDSQDVIVTETGKSSIENILDSLIRSQCSEGED